MKSLVLFSKAFPFGTWEPFLETEVEYYDGFDEVRVFALSVNKEQARTERPIRDPNVSVHKVRMKSRLFYLRKLGKVLGDKEFYRELHTLWRQRRLSVGRVLELVEFMAKSHHEAEVVVEMIRDQQLLTSGSDVVFYSYRFDYQPYVMHLVAEALGMGDRIRIARGHGSDLYEFTSPSDYLPLRGAIIESLDGICLIAQHGLRYLAEGHPEAVERMYISYLGTNDHGLGVAPSSREPLRIVTCSNVVPVKRLDRLTGALATITDLPIHWTHFGDGPLMDRMRARVAELPVNIQTDIRGEISNDGVLAEYARTPFHVLINVSESEGIPVSMMEANSFGIPIIGTDVGGVGEIVETGVNGILLPQLPTPEEIAKAIRAVARLDDDSYASLRRGAREVWETKFDATTNYPRFVSELLSSTQDERRSLTGSER